MTRHTLATALLGTLLVLLAGTAAIAGFGGRGAHPATADVAFKLVRSGAVVGNGCLPDATANVAITRLGTTEQLTIRARGLYPASSYTVFLLQSAVAPFGISVYEGDLHADSNGAAMQTFVGRFGQASFAVGPGAVPAPSIDPTDATSGPQFAPVHLLHLGVWFKTAQRAEAAGCGAVITPFSGSHTAGIQVLSTSQFPITAGPLGKLK